MSLANGRDYLAIPGPSVIPDRVLRAMHRSAPNIYEGELTDMMAGIVTDLKAVARTRHHCALYVGNGHAAWEAALANVFSRGDVALVAATGRFAYGWSDMAGKMGIEPRIIDFGRQAPIDPDKVAAALEADKDHRIRAVLAVQVDTSTSVRSDIAALGTAMRSTGHPALLMVDCIACLACDVFEMDAWGVDVMVAGCQKGLMTPPGMSFVFFNDRADAARESADCLTHYWDWRPRISGAGLWAYFDGTAPTHHLYGLREALDMITEEGLEAVWHRHARLAGAIWAAAEAWAQGGQMQLNIAAPDCRSHAVTTIYVGGAQGTALRKWTEHEAGLTLGIGLGMETVEDRGSDAYFRIGHMGHVNAHMVMGALGAIEAGMRATGIAHGPGGLTAAAREIAGV
ncbi:MAG: alanine--glyoxylate aminotransferase family protein [Rhodobacteraceae bacterium]|nr:alanine--glyoxylate aminotransferase family protein [Paracoccaceae bacterium]